MEIAHMLIYPMSPLQCLLHNVILFHLHLTFSSCMLTRPYHAVIIRLPTKQYYLFVYFLEFSKRVSPKVITDAIDFSKNINSENMNA